MDESEINQNHDDSLIPIEKKPRGRLGLIFLILGLTLTGYSIDYSNALISIIGVSLAFFGALLFYIRPTEYIKKDLMQIFLDNLYENYSHIISGYNGTPFYFTQKSRNGDKNTYIYILKDEIYSNLNNLKKIKLNELDNFNHVKILPPGLELFKHFEKISGKKLENNDIQDRGVYLDEMVEVFIDLLINYYEVAQNIEIKNLDNITFLINIEKYKLIDDVINDVYKKIGDPVTSILAYIIASETNSIVIIKEIIYDRKYKKVESKISLI